jgi:hypothetical protein
MSEDMKKTVPATTENLDTIVIDDGAVKVAIQNQFGERIGTFRFYPTDVNIVNRYNKVSDQFETILAPLINANISPEGEGEDASSVEILNEAGDKMISLMDYVLNANSREAFFSKTHIFTPMGGMFFCEKVYDAIGKYISKRFDAEVNRVNVRMKQHMHGYRTGKHAKGKQ